MDNSKKTSVLGVTQSQIAPRVLVVGDPARAASAAELLQDSEQVTNVREYNVFTGTMANGTRVTIASHGVGASGTSVIMEELLQCGAEVIIRAGTCGVYPRDLHPGDHVVVTAAVREDGYALNHASTAAVPFADRARSTSQYLIPQAYPSVADYRVTNALVQQCETRHKERGSYNFRTGICQTIASLYPGPLGRELKLWERANVVAQDMEASLIFVMASIRGAKAGCILTVDCNVDNDYAEEYDPYSTTVADAKRDMLRLALAALAEVRLESE